MTYAEKLKSPKWQKKRLEILNRDEFTCQLCGDTESTLHVHHLKYEKNCDPWEIDPQFLITYCQECHEDVEGFKKINIVINKVIRYHDTLRLSYGVDIKTNERCIHYYNTGVVKNPQNILFFENQIKMFLEGMESFSVGKTEENEV